MLFPFSSLSHFYAPIVCSHFRTFFPWTLAQRLCVLLNAIWCWCCYVRKINESLQVSAPPIPNSVAVRGTSDSDERLCDTIKCFDLGDLVRDCHYCFGSSLIEDTLKRRPKLWQAQLTLAPLRLAQHGLELRSYQKTSLQWLIDKETNPSGTGTAGELWFLMRGRNGSGNQMFF